MPIASRLGLSNISRQLQDLSFRHIHPLRFQVLTRAMKAVRGNRRELLTKILDGIRSKLAEANIEAGVFGREKSLYSIYHKMIEKRLSFAQVLDMKANVLRIGDGMFIEECQRVARDFPEVQVDEFIVDAMMAHVVRAPQR